MNAEREARREAARRAIDQLYYELIHNLVIETTRIGIEVKNLKMRVESLASRLEFNERRARALESVVVYKPAEPEERPVQRAQAQAQHRPSAAAFAARPSLMRRRRAPRQRRRRRHCRPRQPRRRRPPSQRQEPDASGQGAPAEGPGQRSRRRRRRRGRRGGGSAAAIMGDAGTTLDASAPTDSTEQMDAMDRMDDDGSPESEEAHAVAAETVDQALAAPAERSDLSSMIQRHGVRRGRAGAGHDAAEDRCPPRARSRAELRVVPRQIAGRRAQGRSLDASRASGPSDEIEGRQAQGRPCPTLTRSEARGRRAALRPGDQRRRRAARALHRRAPRAPRRGRGPDDLRHATTSRGGTSCRPASSRSTAFRSAGSASSTSAIRCVFGKRSDRVFEQPHSLGDELDWLDAEGPTSPALVDYIAKHAADYDYCLFFSYRYYHAYHGARAAGSRAILVPTAERDATIGLSIFQPLFRGVRALMYNSPEERAMIQARLRQSGRAGRRRRHRIGRARTTRSRRGSARSTTSAGRLPSMSAAIDENKGCKELFEFFQGYLAGSGGQALARPDRQLAAADSRASAHPPSRLPRRRRQVRRDGGRGSADHAVVLREPVDGGARSVGARTAGAGQRQMRRAEGPVHPQQRRALLRDVSASSSRRCARSSRTAGSAATLGRNGRQFFREHYDWPVIERKYLDMLERLTKETGPARGRRDPLPGWFDRAAARTLPRGAQDGRWPQAAASARRSTGRATRGRDAS